jgi:hypothetical protein
MTRTAMPAAGAMALLTLSRSIENMIGKGLNSVLCEVLAISIQSFDVTLNGRAKTCHFVGNTLKVRLKLVNAFSRTI